MRREMEHSTAEQLLPWYANGTLDSGERQALACHLERCASCREELRLLVDLRGVLRLSAATESPPPATHSQGIDSLPAALRQRVLANPRPVSRVRHLAAGVAAGFLAAIGLAVALGVAYLDAPRFRTASDGAAAGATVRILVEFEPSVALRDVNLLLRRHGAVIAAAPVDGKPWVLEVPVGDPRNAQALVRELLDAPGVASAELAQHAGE